MKKNILLFGAGKSATVLMDYLITEAVSENWGITIVDANKELILEKTGNSPYATAVQMDIEKEVQQRNRVILAADIVISLLPPHLHILVAKDCISCKKNLLTASYLDPAIKALEAQIAEHNLLFLYEMGLDPGIDHMSAMQLIHQIKAKNGIITSFKSHCGGLVAPESDDNPWHYKISWNPRNVVLAGKAGAEFLFNNEKITIPYEDLFADPKMLHIDGLNGLSYYPNRDSLSYIPVYGLEDVTTFVRTTIRHLDFMVGWNNIISLHFTDEDKIYDTNNKSLSAVLKEHLDTQNFSQWLKDKMAGNLEKTKMMLEQLMALQEAEDEAEATDQTVDKDFLAINEKGALEALNLEEIKTTGASVMAMQMHQNNLTLKLLFFLGLDDTTTMVNKGLCSAADILQFALEQKLKLQPEDKDMIVMQHEIEYLQEAQLKKVTSTLVVKGTDATRTGMAKTVGLPLGIAAKLILNGTIQDKGLQIPIHETIYQPVLAALKQLDIRFKEIEEEIK